MLNMMKPIIAAIIGILLAATASADVLVLKNGDRITGEIKRIWDNEITIEPEYSDEFDVDLPIIAYIESDRDFEIDLQDGTNVIASFAGAAEDGDQVITTDVDALEVPLAQIFELDEPEDYYDWESHVDFSTNVSRGNTETLNTQLSGDIMFKGRAAVKLVEGVARRPWRGFDECPYETFDDPGRVHVDYLGNLHICQGVSMGSLFERPLTEIVAAYDPQAHPVIGPLLAGGPAALVERHDLAHEEAYVDACHLCYEARAALREHFPECLTPGQMYGE